MLGGRLAMLLFLACLVYLTEHCIPTLALTAGQDKRLTVSSVLCKFQIRVYIRNNSINKREAIGSQRENTQIRGDSSVSKTPKFFTSKKSPL